jgi:hypothetical protein
MSGNSLYGSSTSRKSFYTSYEYATPSSTASRCGAAYNYQGQHTRPRPATPRQRLRANELDSHEPSTYYSDSYYLASDSYGISNGDERLEVSGVTYVKPARSKRPSHSRHATDLQYYAQESPRRQGNDIHSYGIPSYYNSSTHHLSRSAKRVSHLIPPQGLQTTPLASSHNTPLPGLIARKPSDADRNAHNIPPGYTFKNWDPTEEPILLLGSVFDANRLGKWIYDWTVATKGLSSSLSKMAGNVWLLLIELFGKFKRSEISASAMFAAKRWYKWLNQRPWMSSSKVSTRSAEYNTNRGLPETKPPDPTLSISLSDASYGMVKRRFLALEINGRQAYALPDTGAPRNAVSEEYALSIGAKIDRGGAKHHFMDATNQRFQSVGNTELTISIPGSVSTDSPSQEWTCSFAVVKSLAAPLVLGNHFLQQTKVFTTFAHRMVKRTLWVASDKTDSLKRVRMFMHMSRPTQKLACSLDGAAISAALDTGADMDVVSLKYAISRNLEIKTLPEDQSYALLANNKLVKFEGYVEATLELQGKLVPKSFRVLDGHVHDVLLGDPTIESLDIFNEFQSSIIDTMADEDTVERFHMIGEITHIEQTLENLLAKKRSFFRRGSSRKSSQEEDESW